MDPDCVTDILRQENLTLMSTNLTYGFDYNFTQDALKDCDKTVFPSEEFFRYG